MLQKQREVVSYLAAALVLSTFVFVLLGMPWPQGPGEAHAGTPQRFKSYAQLKNYIERNTKLALTLSKWGYSFPQAGIIQIQEDAMTPQVPHLKALAPLPAEAPAGGAGNFEFSTTNVQVAGVDEADIVKSDGKHLYIVSNSEIIIAQAYPAESARVLSRVSCAGNPLGIFIKDNVLVTFTPSPSPWGLRVSTYEVSKKEAPALKGEFILRGGSYVTSRLVGNYVYLIVHAPVRDKEGEIRLPEIVEDSAKVTVIPVERVQHFDFPYAGYQYTAMITLNLKDLSRRTEILLGGTTQEIFMSQENLYLASPGTGDIIPLLEKIANTLPPKAKVELKKLIQADIPLEEKIERFFAQEEFKERLGEIQEDLASTLNQTTVHKFGVSGYTFDYRGQAQVPGHILNQFSMDEHEGYFRIATTTRNRSWGESENNIFIYDKSLKETGRLTGLAPGERIYAARFLGNRVYLVTFRETDPFFVIDLKDPASPKMLGYLKIPGFSNYLHPYDENHLIGIGKETEIEAAPPPRARAVKIALFDVTDPENPKELSKHVLEKGGSQSLALEDHRAFLFSKTKGLLAIPISYPLSREPISYRNYRWENWQGAYMFNISLERGIILKGTVEHEGITGTEKGDRSPAVKRILYIDDLLYTISDAAIKINRIENMEEVGGISL